MSYHAAHFFIFSSCHVWETYFVKFRQNTQLELSTGSPPGSIQRPSQSEKTHCHHRPGKKTPVCVCLCGQCEPLNTKHIFTGSTLQARTSVGAGFSFLLQLPASGKTPLRPFVIFLNDQIKLCGNFVFDILFTDKFYNYIECLEFSHIAF